MIGKNTQKRAWEFIEPKCNALRVVGRLISLIVSTYFPFPHYIRIINYSILFKIVEKSSLVNQEILSKLFHTKLMNKYSKQTSIFIQSFITTVSVVGGQGVPWIPTKTRIRICTTLDFYARGHRGFHTHFVSGK